MSDPLKPSPALLCALVSVAVHVEEMLSPKGHKLDKAALETALESPGVREWIADMTKLGFAPVKR